MISKHLIFIESNSPGKFWRIVAKSAGVPLGRVEWHAPWKCCVFSARSGTIYDAECLRDISFFCAEQTEYHKRVSGSVGKH